MTCGPLMKERSDIVDITAVRPPRTSVSSPAMSLDRLELKLRERSIIISPKDKDRFVDDLRAINPDIKVGAWRWRTAGIFSFQIRNIIGSCSTIRQII